MPSRWGAWDLDTIESIPTADIPDPAPAPEVVIEVTLRAPDNTNAEWVVRQIVALLADRADGVRLEDFAFIPAARYDSEELAVEA